MFDVTSTLYHDLVEEFEMAINPGCFNQIHVDQIPAFDTMTAQ